jgi:chaperone modulatory protein CbpM
MKSENLISIELFCTNNMIEMTFLNSLQQNGLIDITIIDEKEFVIETQLQQIERYINFYYELGINIEGIETIEHLLERIRSMAYEINTLRNKLQLYETEDLNERI